MLPRIVAGVAVVAVLGVGLACPPARAQSEDGAKVYQETLPAVVWIYSPRGGGKAATGTGSVVDKDRRLVLTNYHVVGDGNSATVVFPIVRGTKVVAERDFYRERLKTSGIKGKVVARDKNADLALIQLDELPAAARALALAEDDPTPGANVHSIGNPGGSGALWVYTPGKVRQVYQKEWKSQLDGEVLRFKARVIETDSATNPGDSGGPLVNDKGQLVGVTQGGSVDARLLSTFVDLSEVKAFLNRRDVKAVPGAKPEPAKAREVIKDDAGLFSNDAVKKAAEDLKALVKKAGKDVVIETVPGVPADMKEKVEKMTREERNEYFQKWTRERKQKLEIDGVYVFISRQPSHLQVLVSESLKGKFGPDATNELVKQLLADFREKKFDEGLQNAVKYLGEKLGK